MLFRSALSNRLGPTGVEHIFSQGTDITAQLVSGSLAGVLSVRDQTIPGLLANLDTLATGLSNALNTSHLAGFDLNGNPGTNLFTAPPLGGVGAAGAIQVAITDPSQIAASSDGSAGSNGNLASLIAVAKQQVAGGQTSTNFYSGIVFSVGSATANAAAEAQASNTILRQLEDQRGSISGVSLDEEASNLIRYQRAYEASAHVFATLSSLTETVINLGKG